MPVWERRRVLAVAVLVAALVAKPIDHAIARRELASAARRRATASCGERS